MEHMLQMQEVRHIAGIATAIVKLSAVKCLHRRCRKLEVCHIANASCHGCVVIIAMHV